MGAELRIGLIGGTGLGEAFGVEAGAGARHEMETPFGRPSDVIIETEWAGVKVLLLARHGPGHLINPTNLNSRANLFALKKLGCTHILASGAVGSLREEFKPRHLVVPDQIIDRTTKRPGTFYESAAVHVEFAEPFCPVLRQILKEAANAKAQAMDAAQSADTVVHDGGCYVCMEGPAFSTRAESLMHRLWGGDLIGMTAMPEAKLAREAEIPYALIALVTDYDSWRAKPATASATTQEKVDPHLLLKEIMGNLRAASDAAMKLIRRAIELMPARAEQLEHCPARRALELAIWSDRSRVPAEAIERLSPLWGRYFEGRSSPTSGPA